ncbi:MULTISPECIES: 2'-5' RNA ligase family protein [Xanthomonas]|uniref:2'-5' RNA ligase n=1 Tax=Xanthomonas phaseoli pv. dieffenbachiae TaxID=92828 RepID=A0A1V9H7F7_9XANT|nr:hypothetical protein [Xanthomonas phaseoli]MBO9766249.1 hypothetical protein [Xanthomonas phaseoli pv. dieffenbachiae]MBO9776796.1 hypothetical protein [Xanthomonas phaseoli pv. dieffenbachiae]MBO9781383.1 hypothetical protein [Xanthomonas phaseoli pv. dieffenbachiae]MBO9789009.1 hypothetical protein [Xanthomonas phaseoli pv. dieffenbachiae]MBO9797365.1 hypothetical protein [Xanthomonas phaseoli pv. dieffenbachiae]
MADSSRLIFMLKPPPQVLEAMAGAVAAHRLDALLGDAYFDPGNWHQSVSDRFEGSVARAAMLRAGDRLDAQAVTLCLNRITSRGTDPVHWAFRAEGVPFAFVALQAAITAALRAEGLHAGGGHTPHVTISYAAPGKLNQPIVPITWHATEVLLVEGGGRPYRYVPIGSWPLQPEGLMPEQAQLPL